MSILSNDSNTLEIITPPGTDRPPTIVEEPEAKPPGRLKRIMAFEVSAERVNRDELLNFSRQLAVFLRAGISILDAMDTITNEVENKSLRRALLDVDQQLRAGNSLSSALERHPKVFTSYYTGILRAAEVTGNVDIILDQLADYLERENEAAKQIRAAMIYPAIVSVMAVVTVLVLSIFVLPRFRTFFEGFNAKLPLATRMLLATTNFLSNYWWAIAGGLIVITLGSVLFVRTDNGRYRWHGVLLKIPALGDTIRCAILERFCRGLGFMLGAGVSMPEALSVSIQSLNNAVYVRALEIARTGVLRGDGFATPISATGLFPATATQMMRVGEDTGTLEVQLETAAGFYGKQLDYKLKKLTSLFEPIIIVVVGLIVGFVAIALVSAMYGIYRQVNV